MPLAPLLASLLLRAPAPDAIVWEGSPECPDRAALIGAIDRRLGRPLGFGEVDVVARVVLEDRAPRYRLMLTLTAGGRSDVRTLTAERCASLLDATALLVALAAQAGEPRGDGEVAPAEDRGPSAPGLAEVVELAPTDVRATEGVSRVSDREPVGEEFAARSARPAPRLGGFVRVNGGPESGAVPGVTGAIGFAAGVLWQRVRLELRGLWLAPRRTSLGTSALNVSLVAGGVHGCGRLGGQRVEFPLCGGIEAGGVLASARGSDARSVTGAWVAGVVGAGPAWRVNSRLTLSLAFEGVVRLAGPRFELGEPGATETLFEPQDVSGRLLVGLELRLGDPR